MQRQPQQQNKVRSHYQEERSLLSAKRLFGTDGIRGIANEEPMTPELAFRLGRALAYYVKNKEKREHVRFLLGRDTRCSGPMLEAALAAGLYSMGADALFAGIIPTPALAFLIGELGAEGGVVISASHNHADDNGLKVFSYDGHKLNEKEEEVIEELILTSTIDSLRPRGALLGRGMLVADALERYIISVTKITPSLSLEGIHIALDCANGAAYQSSPQILRNLGATLFLFHDSADGKSINKNCGSTHGEELQRITLQSQAHLGIAHDGDADRLLLCDEKGNLIDGDEILAITALDALQRGTLRHRTLVTTMMSNFGLDECLRKAGGEVVRTAVGDRHVLEAMEKGDFNIGGEQSGHLIFRDYSTSGDGILAALQVLRIMVEKQQPLSLLRQCLKKYPQVQRHLPVMTQPPLSLLRQKIPLIESIEERLAGKGRLLLRYSGTEPLLRLLIEGDDRALIHQAADQLMEELQEVLS